MSKKSNVVRLSDMELQLIEFLRENKLYLPDLYGNVDRGITVLADRMRLHRPAETEKTDLELNIKFKELLRHYFLE